MIASNVKLDIRDAVEGVLRRIASTAWCQECDQIVELLTVKDALLQKSFFCVREAD